MPQTPFHNNTAILLPHTATAATNTALTETADFSEAEGSTDSDDKDDRLSWHDVRERGKERAVQELSEYQ
jgi:hypothetical protein